MHEVNSRAKIQLSKTTNRNKPVEQKGHTLKHEWQISTRHRFSPIKSSDVHEKTSPRSCIWWKPTGRIFKTIGFRWIPTGKLFDSYTSKVDCEPPHRSNTDITNLYDYKHTLDSSAGTSITIQKEQTLDLSVGTSFNLTKDRIKALIKENAISRRPKFKGIRSLLKF
ncbi:hypothetical protein Tco_1392973 [Tanacetum coccineum]